MNRRYYTGRAEEYNTLEQHIPKGMEHNPSSNDDPLRWPEYEQRRHQQHRPDYVPHVEEDSAAARMGQYPPDVQPNDYRYSGLLLPHEGLSPSPYLQPENSSAMDYVRPGCYLYSDLSLSHEGLSSLDEGSRMNDCQPQPEGSDNQPPQPKITRQEVIDAINVEIKENSKKFKKGDTGSYIYEKDNKYYALKNSKEWENTGKKVKEEILRCHAIYNRIYERIAKGKNARLYIRKRERRSEDNETRTNIRRYARTKGFTLPIKEADTPRKALNKFKEEREKDPSKLSAHAQQRSDDVWNAKAKGYNSEDYETSDPESPTPVVPTRKRSKKKL